MLAANSALADLTAEEVLADHLNFLGGYGLIDMTSIGVTQTTQGLSVEGLKGTYADDKAKVELRLSGFDLVEQDDGSVRIVYPETIPLTIHSDPVDEPEVEVTVALQTTGLTHVASGSRNRLQHDIAFERIWLGDVRITPEEMATQIDLDIVLEIENVATTFSFDDTGPGKRSVAFQLGMINVLMRAFVPTDVSLETPETDYAASGRGDMDLVFKLQNAVGTGSYEATEIPRHRLDMNIENLTWTQESDLPDEEGSLAFSLLATEMRAAYDIALSVEAMETSMKDALNEGQSVWGDFGFASLGYSFGIDTPRRQLPW